RAGDEPGRLAEEMRRDEIAAASRREELDELRVRRRDEDDRERRGRREEHGEVRVPPEREERLLGSVRAGGEAVGPEPDPREERDERELVEALRIERIAALPEEDPLRQFADGHDSREYTRTISSLRDATIVSGWPVPPENSAITSPTSTSPISDSPMP